MQNPRQIRQNTGVRETQQRDTGPVIAGRFARVSRVVDLAARYQTAGGGPHRAVAAGAQLE